MKLQYFLCLLFTVQFGSLCRADNQAFNQGYTMIRPVQNGYTIEHCVTPTPGQQNCQVIGSMSKTEVDAIRNKLWWSITGGDIAIGAGVIAFVGGGALAGGAAGVVVTADLLGTFVGSTVAGTAAGVGTVIGGGLAGASGGALVGGVFGHVVNGVFSVSKNLQDEKFILGQLENGLNSNLPLVFLDSNSSSSLLNRLVDQSMTPESMQQP